MDVLHGQDREREKRSHSLQERPLLRRLPEVERRRRPARPNPPANGWLPLLPCVRDFLQGGQAPGLQEPIQHIQGHQEHRLLAPGEQAREHRADGPVRGLRVPRHQPDPRHRLPVRRRGRPSQHSPSEREERDLAQRHTHPREHGHARQRARESQGRLREQAPRQRAHDRVVRPQERRSEEADPGVPAVRRGPSPGSPS